MPRCFKDSPMQTRRATLRHAGALAGLLAASGLLVTSAHAAYNKAAFDARSVRDALKAVGAGALIESREVTLTTLDIAENGMEVPVAVSASLTGVRQLLILVEKNPAALVAAFSLTDAVEASVAIRTKMSQTSDVYGVAVMADGRMLFARKNVKVTAGGCG
jgi:sulfur-oxidizing protein SoxY